jgi:hypothetical protein
MLTLPDGVNPPSAALQKPDQEGLQYSNCDRTVAWNTFRRACVGIPCVLSTRKAYSDLEQAVVVAATCSSGDRRSLTTNHKHYNFVDSLNTSDKRRRGGGLERASAPRMPGAVISNSSNFHWQTPRLFAMAHLLTSTSTFSQVGVLMLGTIKYVSSANFNSQWAWLTERRSEALTM